MISRVGIPTFPALGVHGGPTTAVATAAARG